MIRIALKKYLPYLILVVLGASFIYLAFGEFIRNPNAYMLDSGADGLKNYVNAMYYLRYDGGTHYTGMNFPYGEHIIFTDNQPIISLFLNVIDNHLFPVSDKVPAIFNVLLFGSLLLTMVMLYRLGRHFQLPTWYAIIAAIVIGGLSPQLHRLHGHYALGYTVFVPLVWWLLIKSRRGENRANLFGGLLVLTCFCFSLIHVYYVMIGGIFVLAYYFLKVIQARKHRSIWINQSLRGLVLGIAPLLLFQVFLLLTDSISDRPRNPYGFFAHRAFWEGVFLASEGPLWEYWNMFVEVFQVQAEGYSYTGIIGLLVAVFSLFRWGRYIAKRGGRRLFRSALPGELNTYLWAGILVLLFSFSFPFYFFPSLLDVLSPLKQFRSLGRFTWVFYYVFSIYIAVYIYLLFRRLRQKQLYHIAGWMVFLVFFSWLADAWIHMRLRRDHINKWEHHNVISEAKYDYGAWLGEAGYTADDFQAILPLPAYFVGSEKFDSRVNYFTSREGMISAWQLHLPLTTGLLSRTSLSQSLKLIQLMSNEYIEKEILKEYPNQKPLLLLVAEGEELSLNEQAVINKATSLGKKDNLHLYRLDLSQLKSKREAILRNFQQRNDSTWVQQGPWYMTPDSTWFHFDSFAEKLPTTFADPIHEQKKGPQGLYNAPIPQTGDMVASVWIRANQKQAGFPVMILREFDAEGKQVNWYESNPKYHTDVYQDFALAEIAFPVQNPQHRFECFIEGKFIESVSFLIRPRQIDLYLPLSGEQTLMFNNYYY